MEPLVTPTKPDQVARPHDYKECTAAIIPVSEVLAQISSKWGILVIGALSDGPKRFSELKRHIEGVSQKMLTSTLRDLERDGFVTRTVTPSIPPRVDYELTDMGRELQQPIRWIGEWARQNHGRVQQAREAFAARKAEAKALSW